MIEVDVYKIKLVAERILWEDLATLRGTLRRSLTKNVHFESTLVSICKQTPFRSTSVFETTEAKNDTRMALPYIVAYNTPYFCTDKIITIIHSKFSSICERKLRLIVVEIYVVLSSFLRPRRIHFDNRITPLQEKLPIITNGATAILNIPYTRVVNILSNEFDD